MCTGFEDAEGPNPLEIPLDDGLESIVSGSELKASKAASSSAAGSQPGGGSSSGGAGGGGLSEPMDVQDDIVYNDMDPFVRPPPYRLRALWRHVLFACSCT